MKHHLSLVQTLLVCAAFIVSASAAEPGKKMETSVSLGLNTTSGNSDTILATGSINAKRQSGKTISLLDLDSAYGETTSETDDGEKNTDITAQNAKAHANVKRLLNDAFCFYTDLFALHDRVADVQYRTIAGAGAGYFLLKTDHTEFSIEAGAGYLWEDVADLDDDYTTLRAAERIDHRISDTAKVWESLEYTPRANEFGDYLLSVELGIEATATTNLKLRFVIQNKHDSIPAEGKEKTDTTVSAALSWTL